MKKQQHSTIAIYGTTNDQFPPNQLVISVYMLYEIWMWDGVNSPSYSCSPPGLQRLQLVSHLQWCPSGLRGCSWSILTVSMTIWCPGFVNGFSECLLAVTTWPTWSMLMTPSCSAHPTVSWELWAYTAKKQRSLAVTSVMDQTQLPSSLITTLLGLSRASFIWGSQWSTTGTYSQRSFAEEPWQPQLCSLSGNQLFWKMQYHLHNIASNVKTWFIWSAQWAGKGCRPNFRSDNDH